jgi:cytochrome c oxidase cbb3-type subunit III
MRRIILLLAGGAWLGLAAVGCHPANAEASHATTSAGAVPSSVRYAGRVEIGGPPPAAGDYRNPDAGNAALAQQGGKVFTAMNCDGCHGVGATGWVGPSLVDGRWRYGGSDGALFQSIYYGRPRGMPAFGGALSKDAIWSIVTWIRAQAPPADLPTESWR